MLVSKGKNEIEVKIELPAQTLIANLYFFQLKPMGRQQLRSQRAWDGSSCASGDGSKCGRNSRCNGNGVARDVRILLWDGSPIPIPSHSQWGSHPFGSHESPKKTPGYALAAGPRRMSRESELLHTCAKIAAQRGLGPENSVN